MKITTHKDDDIQAFRQMKRKTKGGWTFLMSGEWSQSPYHQGRVQFYVRKSEDNRDWAILSYGFVKRIVVVASFIHPVTVEVASGIMLHVLRKRRGEYIEFFEKFGKFDDEKFLEIYEGELPSDTELEAM